jgi:hypothetical protein
MDLPAHTPFTLDLDNTEHILLVELETTPLAAGNKTVNSDLVKGVSVRGTRSGGQVVFDLKRDSRVIASTLMPPSNISPLHRLVIDLAK